jgi:hypothetical protein
MKWNKEDIEKVEKFIEIRNKGFYCDGVQLTEVYNRVLEKHVNPTNCGSCLRQRVNELADALERFKRLSEASKPDEGRVIKEEENKELTEAEMMKERMAKVRAAKKNK